MTLTTIEARDAFARLTPTERASLRAFAEHVHATITDDTLPALLHCWRMSHGY